MRSQSPDFPRATKTANPPRTFRRVVLLCPGGFEHAGGMGRVMAQFAAAWQKIPAAPAIRMIDTRGQSGLVAGSIVFILALLRVASLRWKNEADLLHLNLAMRGSAVRKLMLTALGKVLGIPVIVHLHGSQFDLFFRALPFVLQTAVRMMFLSASRVVVLGEGWRRFVVAEVRVPSHKVVIVRNGTACPEAGDDRSAECGSLILFLGQVGLRKGVPELLQALSSPILRGRPWRAIIAGGGDLGRSMREADRLGIRDRLSFPGWVDHATVDRLLRRAAILVLPSHQEGLPMAVIEALAHGVAVVTTPVGATPELLKDGLSALLVPPGDPEKLATAMARLLADPALRRRLAKQGRAVYLGQLNIERVAWEMLEVYADVRRCC